MEAPSLTLETLMTQAMAGDKRAYAQLLSQSVVILRPFLSKRLNNKVEIDDLTQEILLSIHKARHTYDGTRPYKPWLYAIAKFRLSDHLRSHYKDHLKHASALSDNESFLEQDVTESGLTYESIKEEIDTLPNKQARLLHLIHGEGYTAKEAAEKTGMTETAVKVSAHRAYKILREKLER